MTEVLFVGRPALGQEQSSVGLFKVEPDGIWRFTMHGPDGVEYPNVIRYVEIARNAVSSDEANGR